MRCTVASASSREAGRPIDGATNGQSWCIAMLGQACASLLCACTVRDACVDVCRARYGSQADSGEGWLR